MRRFAAIAGQHAGGSKTHANQKDSFHQAYATSIGDDHQPLLGDHYDRSRMQQPYVLRASTSTLLPHLSNVEELFFHLVQQGNVEEVEIFLQTHLNFNVNCQNYCGYTALTIAALNNDVSMVEYLLQFSAVQLGDSLLHAVRVGNIAVVQLFLNKSRQQSGLIIDRDPDFHASPDSADFTADITPLILAGQTNHYEMIKLLMERGHVINKPHPPDCFCSAQCDYKSRGESLTDSIARYNIYRALISPCYIIQSSDDPILTAFQLSVELRRCSDIEREFKSQYLVLSQQTSRFAVDLLAQCRSTEEVELLLHHQEGSHVSSKLNRYARAALAVELEQKTFVAHTNFQQVLRCAWLEGWHDWKTLNVFSKVARLLPRMFFLPVMAVIYWIIPQSQFVSSWKKPLNKFFSFGASYALFLFMLLFQIVLDTDNLYRGPPTTGFEIPIALYVTGLLWGSIKALWAHGCKQFLRDYWNVYDLIMFSIFYATFVCWFVSVIDLILNENISMPRYKWSQYDPVLIADALYAYAIIFAFGKVMYFFQIGQELGSLQVSMSWMMRDIVKFLVIFFIVLMAFSVGLHMLYHHYEGWTGLLHGGVSGTQDPAFSTYQDSVRTLYWAIYGYSPPYMADIVESEYREKLKNSTGSVLVHNHHQFSQAMGQGIFALYYIAGIIIMFNMLIAMMSTSFSAVQSNADTEWKFARTKVWMKFFEEGSTLPPPFNLVPTPKSMGTIFIWLYRKVAMNPGARWSKGRCCYFEEEEVITHKDDDHIILMGTLVQRYLTQKARQDMMQSGNPPTTKLNQINEICQMRRQPVTDSRSTVVQPNILSPHSCDTTQYTVTTQLKL